MVKASFLLKKIQKTCLFHSYSSIIHQKLIVINNYTSNCFLLNICPLKKKRVRLACLSTPWVSRFFGAPILGYQTPNPLRPKTLEASRKSEDVANKYIHGIYTLEVQPATIFISWFANFPFSFSKGLPSSKKRYCSSVR